MKKSKITIYKGKYYNKKKYAQTVNILMIVVQPNIGLLVFPGGFTALKMMLKFEKYENVLAYTKRFSTVEAPNGTLKIYYHINELLTPNIFNHRIKSIFVEDHII